jgi:hypothetical protein
LARLPGFGGLELPYTGNPRRDPDWPLQHLDPSWDLVLTAIPGTMVRQMAEPGFGLASPDPAGRRAALEFTAGMRDAAARINTRTGEQAVLAVEIHSAPTEAADPASFTQSLKEITSWDWGGAAVTVEHCDAYRPEHAPQKGFLPLAAEIDAVLQAREAGGTPAGITINWARSAIEGRDPALPEEHIAMAREANVLTGLMFSGCSAEPTAYGAPWVDAHLPIAPGPTPASGDPTAAEPSSLLTPAAVEHSLAVAGGQPAFTGVKIGVHPADASKDLRVAHLHNALGVVARASLANISNQDER